MAECAACGKLEASRVIGGALLCTACAEDIDVEVAALRADGKPVNVAGLARARYRELFAAGNYTLRDIPEQLATRLKVHAARSGQSMRGIYLAAAEEYLDKHAIP